MRKKTPPSTNILSLSSKVCSKSVLTYKRVVDVAYLTHACTSSKVTIRKLFPEVGQMSQVLGKSCKRQRNFFVRFVCKFSGKNYRRKSVEFSRSYFAQIARHKSHNRIPNEKKVSVRFEFLLCEIIRQFCQLLQRSVEKWMNEFDA